VGYRDLSYAVAQKKQKASHIENATGFFKRVVDRAADYLKIVVGRHKKRTCTSQRINDVQDGHATKPVDPCLNC
jgi:hypothetical protein